jgi:hypothetical protein
MSQHFGPNIIVDGSSLGAAAQRHYEAEVMQQLTQILMTQTGRAVIAEIWATRRRLRIVPRPQNERNADSRPLNIRAAFAPGSPVRSGSDGRVLPALGRGTGRGSRSEIRYTPFRFAADTGPGQPEIDPGAERGAILLHEMVHSLQQMAGGEVRAKWPGMDTSSEFNAILVTNIYSSERWRTARSHHHGFTPAVDPTGSGVDAGLGELRKCLPGLVARLALIDTQFNPFFERRPGIPAPAAASAGP